MVRTFFFYIVECQQTHKAQTELYPGPDPNTNTRNDIQGFCDFSTAGES